MLRRNDLLINSAVTEFRIHERLHLVSVVHGHSNTAAVFEREHFHPVFLAAGRCEHQLQFTRLFHDIVCSLVLTPQQTTSVSE